ncbi:uncharacterized protein LOC143024557 [Oratosquilla oratoria]|uniref:uncharacterized protein LOC143024557 n=1 Tax=Oratosquilla oratoria TaxID=337810 RepID=UPI003F75AACD
MEHSRITLCFLCVMAVASAANLDDSGPAEEATPGNLTNTSNRSMRTDLSEPAWLDEIMVNECQVDSLPKVSGLRNIATLETQSFFFRPGPSFRQVMFRMRLDAMLTSSPSFEVDGEIIFTKKELSKAMGNATSNDDEPSWLSVQVEDYRQVRKYGRDRIALRVTIAGIPKTLVSDYWWRLNRYEGFELFAEGRSQWAFSCDPRAIREDVIDSPARFGSPDSWWWVIGSGLLLLVVVLFVLMIMAVRWIYISYPPQKRKNGEGPDQRLPPVPPSLRPQGVVNPFVIDPENIYEEIPLNSPDAQSMPSYSTYLSATRESKIPKSPQHLAKKKSFYAFMMEKNPWFSSAAPEPETQRSNDNVYELHPVGRSCQLVLPGPKVLESPYVDMNQGSCQQRTWPLPHKSGEPQISDDGHVKSRQEPDAKAHYANLTTHSSR